MKRWARRNLPTVVLLAALILLAALVLAIAMPRETENTPVVSAAISPTFDEAAYQSRLEVEAYPVHTICQSLPKRQTASLAEKAASSARTKRTGSALPL